MENDIFAHTSCNLKLNIKIKLHPNTQLREKDWTCVIFTKNISHMWYETSTGILYDKTTKKLMRIRVWKQEIR